MNNENFFVSYVTVLHEKFNWKTQIRTIYICEKKNHKNSIEMANINGLFENYSQIGRFKPISKHVTYILQAIKGN